MGSGLPGIVVAERQAGEGGWATSARASGSPGMVDRGDDGGGGEDEPSTTSDIATRGSRGTNINNKRLDQ